MRNLLIVAVIGLVVYTVIDVARSEADERYGVSRPLWILLILLLPVLGSIAWLFARSQARARGAGGGSGGSRPRGARPRPRTTSGPVAPDDDPEFLWRLEQMQRRADADRERGPDAAPPPGAAAGDDSGRGGPRGDTPHGDDSPDRDTPGQGTPDPRAGA